MWGYHYLHMEDFNIWIFACYFQKLDDPFHLLGFIFHFQPQLSHSSFNAQLIHFPPTLHLFFHTAIQLIFIFHAPQWPAREYEKCWNTGSDLFRNISIQGLWESLAMFFVTYLCVSCRFSAFSNQCAAIVVICDWAQTVPDKLIIFLFYPSFF